MQFEVGMIVDGTITGVAKFGAFVSFAEGQTGMVHISEIASTYVKEVSDFVETGQKVKVKIINISDIGKIGLSIKQVPEGQNPQIEKKQNDFKRNDGKRNNVFVPRRREKPKEFIPTIRTGPPPELPIFKAQVDASGSSEFEEMMKKFKQRSEDKISDLKKSTESKRGGGRRGSK